MSANDVLRYVSAIKLQAASIVVYTCIPWTNTKELPKILTRRLTLKNAKIIDALGDKEGDGLKIHIGRPRFRL